MNENRPPTRDYTWFWAVTLTVVAVLLLWLVSQVAVWSGQDVAWYAGFGQWLGALASLIVAGVALWIAVSERRQADRRHEAELVTPARNRCALPGQQRRRG